MKIIKFSLLLFCATSLISCGRINATSSLIGNSSAPFNVSSDRLGEVPTPKVIKELNQQLEQYRPQVKIVSPAEKQVFSQTNVDVRLEIEDLPIFRDEKLNLGSHLNLILDNEPAKQIYDVAKPILLENLTPGTHTVRVFAVRPWGESFKNNSAYAQRTFSVLTETNNNNPEPSLPLLTYNNPTGTYGAEPFLLDFYLTNAPLHSVAQNNPQLQDWRIKATVNGDSFLLENWQPVYLTGLNQGENWIQLELIDEQGNDIENTFNNTVRVIDYDPTQSNTLSKLLADKISVTEARSLIEQNNYIEPVDTSEIAEPTVEPKTEPKVIKEVTKTIEPLEEPTVEDTTEIADEPEVVEPTPEIEPRKVEAENNPSSISAPDVRLTPTEEVTKQPVVIPAPSMLEAETKTIENDLAESTKATQTITITESDSDSSEPIAEIEIPQLDSVEITDDEVAITIPSTETNAALEVEGDKPVWWKKLLVGLRQKLEGLVKLLPNKV